MGCARYVDLCPAPPCASLTVCVIDRVCGVSLACADWYAELTEVWRDPFNVTDFAAHPGVYLGRHLILCVTVCASLQVLMHIITLLLTLRIKRRERG